MTCRPAPLGTTAIAADGQRLGEAFGVGGADEGGRVAAELSDRALRDPAAVGDDDDVVDGLLDLGEHVARDQQGSPFVGEVPQEAAQPPDALGVQAVGRLVEDDHLRVAEQGGGEAEALAHPHRVAAGSLACGRGDADELEQLVDAPVGHPGDGGLHPEVVAAGAPRVEVRRLEGGADDGERVG